MITNYTEVELKDLILNQVEENLHLDYKGSDALSKADSKKKDISKDVSSFANSDGGTIIYGIKEFDEPEKRHLPEKIDPINRTDFSKEWLEQVINSNIQPRISGLSIVPIQLSTDVNHVVFVVNIPQSNTAHQALDKRYYKRFNFESMPMDDYEIKDILNRQSNPILQFEVDPINTVFFNEELTIPLTIANYSVKMARDVKLTFEVQEQENCQFVRSQNLVNLSYINQGKLILGTKNDSNIYKGLALQVGKITLRLLNNTTRLTFTATIYADNMDLVIRNFSIEIIENQAHYL